MKKITLLLIILLVISCGDDDSIETTQEGNITFQMDGVNYESVTLENPITGSPDMLKSTATDFFFAGCHFFRISGFFDADNYLHQIDLDIVLTEDGEIEEREYDNEGEVICQSYRNTEIEVSYDFCGTLEFYSTRDAVVTYTEIGDKFSGSFSGTLTLGFLGGNNPCSPDSVSISGTFNNVPLEE